MAKRSRRVRKQQSSKPTPQPVAAPVQPTPVAEKPQPAAVEKQKPAPQPAANKLVNFAEDYFYVYTELRNVTIVAVLMFVIMFGLAYFV